MSARLRSKSGRSFTPDGKWLAYFETAGKAPQIPNDEQRLELS
jgi:hypothetical protein